MSTGNCGMRTTGNERFDNLDGLRTISCLGIIAMHVLANTNYRLNGWLFESFIPSCSLFVYMFFIISGFGMFCGYYEKIKNNDITLDVFYTKRYSKIFPFFVSLILIDLVYDLSLTHIIEGVTESTLVYGLLPNIEFSVIGVGWTIGVVFLFYMLFPFVVFLFWNKKRACFTTFISIVLSTFCSVYFFSSKYVNSLFTPRHNILYSFPYFAAGGLIYMYRKEIINYFGKINKKLSIFVCLVFTSIFYIIIYNKTDIGPYALFLFVPWFIYSISYHSILLNNSITSKISKNSLEYYLSHMVVFRLVEKCGILHMLDNDLLDYITVLMLVVIGLQAFVIGWKFIYNIFINLLNKKG